MAARLVRTDTIIEECERHLEETQGYGSPVESYLTQHALIVLSAEVQTELYAIVENRVAKVGDKAVAAFAIESCKRLLRSVKKENIAGFIGHFGTEVKTRFNASLEDREVTIFNNAIENRHDVAHKSGVQVTFSELKLAVAAARKILEAFEKELSAM
jgi:hypothetical protein